MNALFEYTDRLNAPYECFIVDANIVQSHWHYFMEIIYMIEGKAMMNCDGESYIMEQGDLLLFLPNQIHSIYAVANVPMKYYVLKFDISQLAPSANASTAALGGIHFNSLFRIAKGNPAATLCFRAEQLKNFPLDHMFQEACEEMRRQDYGYRIMMQSNISMLLTYILRCWRENGFDTDKSLALLSEDETIYSITEYIDSHIQEALKVEELAELCHMSYSYFAKTFREVYGQSCKKYIEFVRLCKAEDLLLFTNLDLNYISQETGFSDCSHFIKAFKVKHGITPKQYRKQHTSVVSINTK